MYLFVQFNSDRVAIDFPDTMTIEEAKVLIKDRFGIHSSSIGEHEVMVLHYAGADLFDEWFFADIGIPIGSTIHVQYRHETWPILLVSCAFNGDFYKIMPSDRIDLSSSLVWQLKSEVREMVGIPVSMFRLVSKFGVEMFDQHSLSDYEVEKGDTVYLETWDGWSEFLNLSTRGFSSHVINHLSRDELTSRFQSRVALYIAAHQGHIDLAVNLLRLGVRADEPVGEHPSRVWCSTNKAAPADENENVEHESEWQEKAVESDKVAEDTKPIAALRRSHVDTQMGAVHVAAERGHLDMLRMFVHQNICVVLAQNGNGLKALNICLRRKHKSCASFLLTKQWTKIAYSTTQMPLHVYSGLKKWAEKAKDRASFFYGERSGAATKKTRGINFKGALVGTEVVVDGYTASRMNSRHTDRITEERTRRADQFRAKEELRNEQGRRKLDKVIQNMNKRVSFERPGGPGGSTGQHLPSIFRGPQGRGQTGGGADGKQSQDAQAEKRKPTLFGMRRATTILGGGEHRRLSIIADRTEAIGEDTMDDVTDEHGDEKHDKGHSTSSALRSALRGSRKLKRGTVAVEAAVSFAKAGSELHRLESTDTEDTEDTKPQAEEAGGSRPRLERSGPQLSTPALHRSRPTQQQAMGEQTDTKETQGTATRKQSAAVLAKARAADTSIPLPMVSHENRCRPYFAYASQPILDVLGEYERYRGEPAREYAIKCLSLSNAFKKKAWLQQVRIAMRLSEQRVRRSVTFVDLR